MVESLRVKLGKFAASGPALPVILVFNLFLEFLLILKDPGNITYWSFVATCVLMVVLYWLMVVRPARKKKGRK